MALFVTGDTHGEIDISKLRNKSFNSSSLSKEDNLIICGDFGYPWVFKNDILANNEKYWLKWLTEKRFTTLFADGNHENHDILSQLEVTEWHNGYVHNIYDYSVKHLMRGNMFILDGLRVWVFGGATSHDKECRREGISWFVGEIPTQDEMQYGVNVLERYGMTADIIITHTPPRSIKQMMGFNDTCEVASYLEFIKNNVSYKHWFCGHMHKDIDFKAEKISVLYNRVLRIT